MDDLYDEPLSEVFYQGLKSRFDRSLAYLLHYLDWLSESSKKRDPDIEAWLGIDRYNIALTEFKAKCKNGLLPREILFCYDAYKPNEKRISDYDWLRVIRVGDQFVRSKEGLTTRINRNNLDQHLRKLVRMRVLAKKNGRYIIGPSQFIQPGAFTWIQKTIKEARQEESWSDSVVTLIGLDTRDKAFYKTNKELMHYARDHFIEGAAEINRLFMQDFQSEFVWHKDGSLETIDVTKRKPGLYDKLPLIVINPNAFVRTSRSIKDQFLKAAEIARARRGDE